MRWSLLNVSLRKSFGTPGDRTSSSPLKLKKPEPTPRLIPASIESFTALSLAWGAWKRRGDVMLPALGLFGIALTGRLINLVAQGPYEGWIVPVGVEAFHCLVIVLAMRAWGWPKKDA